MEAESIAIAPWAELLSCFSESIQLPMPIQPSYFLLLFSDQSSVRAIWVKLHSLSFQRSTKYQYPLSQVSCQCPLSQALALFSLSIINQSSAPIAPSCFLLPFRDQSIVFAHWAELPFIAELHQPSLPIESSCCLFSNWAELLFIAHWAEPTSIALSSWINYCPLLHMSNGPVFPSSLHPMSSQARISLFMSSVDLCPLPVSPISEWLC